MLMFETVLIQALAVLGRAYFRNMLIFEKMLINARVRFICPLLHYQLCCDING